MATRKQELADMDLDLVFEEVQTRAEPPTQAPEKRRRSKKKEKSKKGRERPKRLEKCNKELDDSPERVDRSERVERKKKSSKAGTIVKRIIITIFVLAVMVGMAFGMWYLVNVYTGIMIKDGIEEGIANFGYNDDVIFEGDYLTLTTEGDEYVIRPKDKSHTIGFKDWVNKYYTITDRETLETSDGTLQEYGFEVYYINSNPEVSSWEGWLHCEVYRNVIVIKDAEGECDEDTLKDLASTFITLIEPKLDGAEGN